MERKQLAPGVHITTLEAMLNQDGLTHDFAADFGAK